MVASLRNVRADVRASAIPTVSVRPSLAAALALGRIEARKMLTHPAYAVALGFGLLLFRGIVGIGGTGGSRLGLWLAGGLLMGALVGTVLTSNIAALRPRRDRTLELYGSLPAPPETRTFGSFVGLLLGPGVVALVLTAIAWWVFKHDSDVVQHTDGFLMVQFPLAILALGTIAIAVGRWLPSLVGGPLIIVAHLFTPILWAVPWVMPRSSGIAPGWHMVYIAAAFTTWIALALARDRRTLARLAIAGGAFAVGIYAIVQQTPPGGY